MTTYSEAVEQTITAGEQIHQIVNGTATTEVTVEDGSKVPSIRKALLDNFYFKDPIAWQVGQTENVFNQLRQFTDGSWWYAPSATASNPVSMGITPVGDSLWKIYDFDAIGKLTPQIRESLRRSYAEAGYNLVDGSFEAGGTLVNANDVPLQERTGKAFSGPAGAVAAGTNPASGGFTDKSNVIKRTYSSVAAMVADAVNVPVGTRVEWMGYYADGDGGGNRGIVKSGVHVHDGGSIFSLGASKYVQAYLRDSVLALKFGVKFDDLPASAASNTTCLQAFLNYVTINNREGVLGWGVAWHNGLTITKSSRLRGIKTSGPEFGIRTSYAGSTLRNNSTTQSSITIDATGNPNNVGLHAVWNDFTVYGNRNVSGAVGGHNIVLKADNTGETTFIEGCQFRNIQSIYAKENGWAIQGTVFANDWWGCSSSYNGTNGLSRILPDSGNPITNNFHGCKFFENLQWGVYNNGIQLSLFDCNIAQNHAGGLLAESGYVESINCDYEQNVDVAIESRNSSGAGILVTGGKIHKTPGTEPGFVGIRAAAGTSGGIVRDVLFVNFTSAGDKIFESTGGNMQEFGYRLQNVTTGQLTPTDMTAIIRIPPLDFPRFGTVTFAGNGPGRRSATVTFSEPFKVGYTITGTPHELFSVNPTGAGLSVDPATKTLSQVTLFIDVTASVDAVTAEWTAIGR